ncbi:PqqD family protein [Actinomycetes bacterium M1A6_2h]
MDQTLKVQDSRVTWTESGSEVVILDLEGSNYFSLNEAGTVLWPLLVEGATEGQLIDALIAEYEIDSEVATRDVQELLSGLSSREIVKAVDAGH